MNPLVTGLFRAQQMQAAERAAAIRMSMATNTGYLNPQEGQLILSGAPAYASDYAASYIPTYPVPVPAGFPVSGFGPEAYQAFADYKQRQAFASEVASQNILAQAYQTFLQSR